MKPTTRTKSVPDFASSGISKSGMKPAKSSAELTSTSDKATASPLDTFKEFITASFAQMASGSIANFDYLVKQVKDFNSPGKLAKWFLALSQTVSALRPQHEALIRAAIGCDLYRAAEATIASTPSPAASSKPTISLSVIAAANGGGNGSDPGSSIFLAYSKFVKNLLSDRATYVQLVLEHLVKLLVPSPSGPVTPGTNPTLPDAQAQVLVFSWVHQLLPEVLDTVPTGGSWLSPLLSGFFPYRTFATPIQVAYVRNLLKMTTYMPTLRAFILNLIFEKLIQIDVEIKMEDSFDDEDNVFELELSDVSRSEPSERNKHFGESTLLNTSMGGGTPGSAATALAASKELEEKLDSMIYAVFEHFQKLGESPTEGRLGITAGSGGVGFLSPTSGLPRASTAYRLTGEQTNERDQVFEEILDIFTRVVLTTHRSKCTQFLVFYLCSFDDKYAHKFVDAMLTTMFEDSSPDVLRLSCGLYVASFLSRASYLSLTFVQETLKKIVVWIEKYMATHASAGTERNYEAHCVFHSAVQVLLYVFCFKFTEFLEQRNAMDWISKLNLPKIAESRFNPFKVISQSVVRQFSEVASRYMTYDFTRIIERNRREPLMRRQHSTSTQLLESFFPFDPFPLPRSATFVETLFSHWKCEGEDTDSGTEEKSFDNLGKSYASTMSTTSFDDPNSEGSEPREGSDEEEEDSEDDENAMDRMAFTPGDGMQFEFHMNS